VSLRAPVLTTPRGEPTQVFRGTYHGAEVAWKTLTVQVNDNLLEEFFREVTTMSRLRHPNVIHFYGYTPPPDMRIVMVCGGGRKGEGGGADTDDGRCKRVLLWMLCTTSVTVWVRVTSMGH